MRFSVSLGRGDAHCGLHLKCKCDRRLRQGSLGFSMGWLALTVAKPRMKIFDLTLAKEHLSQVEQKSVRDGAREWLTNRAQQEGPDSQAARLLRLEATERDGDTSEPESLRCTGITRALLHAAQAT